MVVVAGFVLNFVKSYFVGSSPGETTANHCKAPILGAFFIALLRLLKYMLKLPRKVPAGLTLFDMLFVFRDQVIMISQK